MRYALLGLLTAIAAAGAGGGAAATDARFSGAVLYGNDVHSVVKYASLDGRTRRTIVRLRSGGYIGDAVFSPTGRRAVLTESPRPRLYAVRLPNGRPRLLGRVATGFGRPVWSPAGDEVAFPTGRCDEDGTSFYDLYIADTRRSRGALTRVLHRAAPSAPVFAVALGWSRRDELLYGVLEYYEGGHCREDDHATTAFYALNVRTGTERLIARTGAWWPTADWSPDGTRIVYATGTDAYVADGTAPPRQVFRLPYEPAVPYTMSVRWAANGKEVFVGTIECGESCDESTPPTVYAVDVDTAARRVVARRPGAVDGNANIVAVSAMTVAWSDYLDPVLFLVGVTGTPSQRVRSSKYRYDVYVR